MACLVEHGIVESIGIRIDERQQNADFWGGVERPAGMAGDATGGTRRSESNDCISEDVDVVQKIALLLSGERSILGVKLELLELLKIHGKFVSARHAGRYLWFFQWTYENLG